MVKIGIVGTGNMADGYHAKTLDSISDVNIVACCDKNVEALEKFAGKWKIGKTYTDYGQMIDSEDLDGICNVTPDSVHAEVSIYALEHGVSVLCEKPMAVTIDEAQEMAKTARLGKAIHMVNYSKRDFPGLRGAKSFIDDGGLGRIMHVEVSYLQGWLSGMDFESAPTSLLWRLSTTHGSNGDLGDLGCHIYDMASFLCGDISALSCTMKTYPKPVQDNRVGEYVFDANDGFVAHLDFACGAIGSLQSTRWATGFKNREFIRVYGDKATLEFDADIARNTYRFIAVGSSEWEQVEVEDTPNNVQRFIESIKTGINDPNDFENGLKIQAYLHASVESDASGMKTSIEY